MGRGVNRRDNPCTGKRSAEGAQWQHTGLTTRTRWEGDTPPGQPRAAAEEMPEVVVWKVGPLLATESGGAGGRGSVHRRPSPQGRGTRRTETGVADAPTPRPPTGRKTQKATAGGDTQPRRRAAPMERRRRMEGGRLPAEGQTHARSAALRQPPAARTAATAGGGPALGSPRACCAGAWGVPRGTPRPHELTCPIQ